MTSLLGTTLRWSDRGQLVEAQPPVPAPVEMYGHDGYLRRISRTAGSVEEFYLYEGPNRVGVIHEGAAGAVVVDETVLFAGVDDALRMKRGATTVYFETDLAGNVRRLRAPGGGDLGGYRYSAFGKTLEDSTTVVQWLRFKGRWASDVAGGIYDVRARQWSPQLGAFLSIDELDQADSHSTLWGWPSQNPVAVDDPAGLGGTESNPVQDLVNANLLPPGLTIFGKGQRMRANGIAMMANDATFEAGAKKAACGSQLMTAGANITGTDATVIVGIAQFGAGAARSATGANFPGHHPIPKFLGGNQSQRLVSIPRHVHVEFHQTLHQNLRAAGFSLSGVGGPNGSKAAWAVALSESANPGAQNAAFDAVLATSRQIDYKYGTNITTSVWENFLLGNFRGFE